MASSNGRSVLIINPNTTQAMTDALKPLVHSLGYETTRFDFFTAPSGVPSINNEDDAAISAKACLPVLVEQLADYDAFLVCCYSHHPLVALLRSEIAKAGLRKPVTGIFEASVATCLQGINAADKFGIVSTGSQWGVILADAVTDLLGSSASTRYAGTKTTGLNADELHSTPKPEVDARMRAAVKKLLQLGTTAICLGCAGMAGMDQTVREACVEHLGEVEGQRIMIVDGVVSGVVYLEGSLRSMS
ncbi:hydantoin racemase (Dcg1) like protein [Zymoseptoria brevis]|uniref:Hydantoin racemase (Dcg1) like protein n=1 Tax=Zymoseptoria brevis TaxID=1047168 RepID=A0A0F4G4W3_9PEZI|nr:hydantoin racemase (Dcg1) like protein [Zymoseptoria brevis]